mmetsp:Transcript_104426/g.248419  ORF Transcript_104426/g.248419 Transcript_104426/m.248419 type:complete len:208 (+) Transcript_104426:616-1239(+)
MISLSAIQFKAADALLQRLPGRELVEGDVLRLQLRSHRIEIRLVLPRLEVGLPVFPLRRGQLREIPAGVAKDHGGTDVAVQDVVRELAVVKVDVRQLDHVRPCRVSIQAGRGDTSSHPLGRRIQKLHAAAAQQQVLVGPAALLELRHLSVQHLQLPAVGGIAGPEDRGLHAGLAEMGGGSVGARGRRPEAVLDGQGVHMVPGGGHKG